jgi:hypothetical protein
MLEETSKLDSLQEVVINTEIMHANDSTFIFFIADNLRILCLFF